MYFSLKRTSADFSTSTTANTTVFAPGDATITRINLVVYPNSNRDYTIYFQPCKEFSYYFYHVSSISQKLLDALNSGSGPVCNNLSTDIVSRQCAKLMNLQVQGGEQIGYIGGLDRTNSNALDLGAFDFRITPLTYANSSRWFNDLYVVCPIDYYSPDIKTKIYSTIGDYDGKTLRTINPICGQSDQDILNTVQGAWFFKGPSTYTEEPNIALIHDNINPLIGVFSVGTSMKVSGLSYGTYSFNPNNNSGLVNHDFNQVTSDGNIYCYDTTQGRGQYTNLPKFSIIIQMPTSTSLKVERLNSGSCGSGPWSFDSLSTDFIR